MLEFLRSYCCFGFHLSRKSWEWLELTTLGFDSSGPSKTTEIYLLRQLVDRINRKLVYSSHPPEPIYAGQLASASVLVDIFRYIVQIYCQEEQPGAIPRGLDWVGRQRDQYTISKPPLSFVAHFPPLSVLQGKQSETDYINRPDSSLQRENIMRELILLPIAVSNPAFKPFKLLFDDSDLKMDSPYIPLIQGLENFFATQPPFGPVGLTLFECLRAPILASPDSLKGQLDYILRHWAHFLPLELLEKLMMAVDILEEEQTLRGLGPGQSLALRFDRDAFGMNLGYAEPSAFSPDADWMSTVVLMAKSIYVWLYQLSRKYQRDIHLLNDIPDEELDQLARWGFTGLWLIGLWERSSASRKIKNIMGNPEAVSSAYSLYDYVIAHDLGGEDAFQQLKQRASKRGIRLASDMVPNHMGIYSKWVTEHPQWFLQSDYPPFPAYQYTGVDLSDDPRVCIQIDDGYWQHRDAAVVFKRIDKWTGDAKYIYHGNDGTSMPWNDTAQLNFLIPEVREAVIQTILHVARKFPIIRFDAAMTLAKRHYQRLWFPQPGEGGAIPSRAEHGMTKAQFDALLPKEFWREVVDRVAKEQPDTLLLAEAFWLMEGYFVRTLGMHRVYNSAFMNMLKMEDNAKYRTTIRNVLEFSPEVLKRFVNFMNNPDERSAVDQFGRGDKYYGVTMMMVTMPGLPMFGHGQVEGFAEKYGMEYRRSYWDEPVDQGMVERHEREIFPLMRRRRLFSGAANFSFYDFRSPEGWVDENVFAYSNRFGDERAVILYNNAYNTTRGQIHTSTAVNIGDGDNVNLVRRSLSEALGLTVADNCFYTFRDYRTGLEYIRHSRHLADQGLFVELHAYQYHAFLDFQAVYNSDGSWAELERRLNGAGVANLEETHRELQLEPVLGPFRNLMNPAMIEKFRIQKPDPDKLYREALSNFYEAIKLKINSAAAVEPWIKSFLTARKTWNRIAPDFAGASPEEKKSDFADPGLIVYAWLILKPLADNLAGPDASRSPASAMEQFDHWLLPKVMKEFFSQLLKDPDQAYWDSRLVMIWLAHPDWFTLILQNKSDEFFRRLIVDPPAREYLQINKYQDTLWLTKEKLERLIKTLGPLAYLSASAGESSRKLNLSNLKAAGEKILSAAEQAGYRVEILAELLNPSSPKPESD